MLFLVFQIWSFKFFRIVWILFCLRRCTMFSSGFSTNFGILWYLVFDIRSNRFLLNKKCEKKNGWKIFVNFFYFGSDQKCWKKKLGTAYVSEHSKHTEEWRIFEGAWYSLTEDLLTFLVFKGKKLYVWGWIRPWHEISWTLGLATGAPVPCIKSHSACTLDSIQN